MKVTVERSNLILVNDLQAIGEDKEPRIADRKLAEALGFERPRVIRELIHRSRRELERHGITPHRTAKSGMPGRPSHEFWLNESQALVICMRSDAPRAPDIRAEIV